MEEGQASEGETTASKEGAEAAGVEVTRAVRSPAT